MEKAIKINKIIIIITSFLIFMFFAIGAAWFIYCKYLPEKENRLQTDAEAAAPVVASAPFMLTSDAGVDGGILPAEYTCDGAQSSPSLYWSNAPAGTKEFALMMTTIPVDGSTKWGWVLYGIPVEITGLAKNTSGVGICGVGSHNADLAYQSPCSQGPGMKEYTFTLYALSASPELPDDPDQVTGQVLTEAISGITLDSARISFNYERPQ